MNNINKAIIADLVSLIFMFLNKLEIHCALAKVLKIAVGITQHMNGLPWMVSSTWECIELILGETCYYAVQGCQ
jgi:hypothetical protein